MRLWRGLTSLHEGSGDFAQRARKDHTFYAATNGRVGPRSLIRLPEHHYKKPRHRTYAHSPRAHRCTIAFASTRAPKLAIAMATECRRDGDKSGEEDVSCAGLSLACSRAGGLLGARVAVLLRR
jgi:hypothetical protein